jgi:5-methylcytosine-specific restriction endonuclease McrA
MTDSVLRKKTGPKRRGREVPCMICSTMIYRDAAYLARTKRVTCGASECRSKAGMGEHNPFWGRAHDEATIQRIRETKRARPTKKRTGPPKGYKHTPEALAKITEANRRRWRENRDMMLAARAHLRKERARELLRYRRNFTPLQRREWKAEACQWCGGTHKLVLDHIIPVMCGGRNERRNAQTLCQPCNVWKMWQVDRPLFLAGLGHQQG